MSGSTPVFSYKNAILQSKVIPFERTKSADGKYAYFLPKTEGRDSLDFCERPQSDGDGCLDVIHWSDKEKFIKALQKSETDMAPCDEDFRIILPTGETIWLCGVSTPKKSKDGAVVWTGFWVNASDERKNGHFSEQVLAALPDAAVIFDRQGVILKTTERFRALIHKEGNDLRGLSVFSVLSENVAETLRQYLLLSTLKDRTVFCETLTIPDYPPVRTEIEIAQKDGFFIGVFRDISVFERLEERLKYLAYHDTESGVENYAYLKEVFPKIVDQAKVTQTQVAVLSIAPDSLGQINAVSAHLVNTRLIAAVADRIRSCLSNSDVLALTCAHHFTVLLTGVEFSIEIEKKVESVLKAFKEPVVVDDVEFDFSVSIGVCFYPQNGKKLEELINFADLALEKARSEAQSSMRLYSSDFSTAAAVNRNMRKNLKAAIENGEITAYYQPQVAIQTGQIIGLEALARWKTPDGLIPPADFIAEAEEYGLIDALTETVLSQACNWNQKWYSMGLCNVPVAVNISARQFHNETQLLRLVDNALDKSGLPPYLLELELTESSAMFDPKNARRIIQNLLDNNIRCALDDFGTGYSSLSVLRSFPLKKLKIDRSFVLDLKEKKNLEIVRATIAMAHALNLTVLAEGVETRRHFEILKSLECDVIQGYLFSQPLSAEETELLLMRWDAGLAATGKGL